MNESVNDVLMKDFKLCVKSLKKSEKKCEKLQQEKQQLKDKIDKAIKYIEHYTEYYKVDGKDYLKAMRNYGLEDDQIPELLKLLKGDNND